MADDSANKMDLPKDGVQLHKSVGRIDNLKQETKAEEGSPTVHKTISTTSAQPVAAPESLDAPRSVSAITCAADLQKDSESSKLQSFVTAVHKKYNDDSSVDYGLIRPAGDIVFVPKTGPVKLTASGNIVLPRQVSMCGCEIDVAGDPVLIQKMCQKVKELDLMENNIHNWEEVIGIIESIPSLTFLNLTKNHLTSDLPDLSDRRLPNLTHLVLNNTMITWETVLRLLAAFHSIEELHLSLNGFESVDIPAIRAANLASTSTSESAPLTTYPNLRKLFFVGNKVLDWRELNKLGLFFPNLEFLLISETELTSIEGFDDIPYCFPCLLTLGLNRTHLRSWDELQKLRLFPSLTDVRLNCIPFLEEFAEKFRRQHTVALLPNIHSLNGSPIKEVEREDAERAYIRLYMDKEEKSKRYYELEKQHGKLNPLAKIILKPQLQVKLKVRVEGPNQELIKAEEMNIDVNQTIRDLKKLLSNTAGCSVAKFQLYYQESEGMGIERLSFSDRKVHSYSMRDGDELIIACKE